MESIDNTSEAAHEAVDKIASATNKAAEALRAKKTRIKDAEQQFMTNCRGYALENPLTSLGIAVAGGFILSRLLSGR